MQSLSVGLVLVSALLHAYWNALVKSAPSKFFTIFMLQATCAVLVLPALPFVGPPSAGVLFFVGLSVLLHLGYNVFLVLALRAGDLSHVYPIARGSGPVVVALASVPLVGERLKLGTLIGILLITAGIALLTFQPGTKAGRKELTFALVTGLFIGSYTIVDGMGARAASQAANYIVYLFLGEGITFSLFIAIFHRSVLQEHFASQWRRGVAVGVLAGLAYAIVIWAMALNQLAFVAALRETSVVFAAILGSRMLGESFGHRRVLAASIVAVGAVVMNLYR